MTDSTLTIEELIDLAISHVDNANNSLFKLNKTMDKLSKIENVKEICSGNENYQKKLKELEFKIHKILSSIEEEEF